MPVTIKPDRVATYNKELSSISQVPFVTWSS